MNDDNGDDGWDDGDRGDAMGVDPVGWDP